MLDVLVIVVASAIAAAIDAYTGEIPEWITIPLALTGITYAWFAGYFVASLVAAVATLAVGYLLYYTGELGGGDVLLLTGISAWKPFVVLAGIHTPSALAILVLGLVLSSVFFSVFYSLQLGVERRAFLVIPIPYLFLPPVLAALYGAGVTSYLGQKYRSELFVRERKVNDLVPEDVLAEPVDVLPPGKKVLERKDIDLLREKGVKSVKILDNLPRFGPFILLALLLLLVLEANPSYLHCYAATLFPLNLG